MIRLIVVLVLAVGLAYCGSTVKLGKRTFFGHVRAIWATDAVQDLTEGVKDSAGPTVTRVKRGVKKGIEAAKEADTDTGSAGSGSQHAPTPALH
ncbi:MAG: hypothetical protein H0X17_06770 [Deltaproteobacteria bacterium]|nr:hypothetical protein [Deltaproteobacteria bacterium]